MNKGKSKSKSSDGKHSTGIKGGHPLIKHIGTAGKNVKRKVVKGKSLSGKKSKSVKRNKQGTIQKSPVWKAFMA